VLQILKYLVLFLLWSIVGGLSLLIPAPLGLLVALPVAGLFLLYLVRDGSARARRRWATLRLRPIGGAAWLWVALAVPVLLLASWALGEVYTRLVEVPPEDFNPFVHITTTPMGRLSIAVLAIGVAPVLEEFVFRGVVQRTLERRWGTVAGICLSAALFGAVHMLPRVFPLLFFLGVAFGCAVYATRSIWAGVVLHAANNSVAVLGLGAEEARPSPPLLWQSGATAEWWIALAVLALSIAAGVWIARRLRRAAQGRSMN
jgi:membrane protease YdiL (CAAX protease family)